jgi:hypothetical protein
VDKRRAVTRLLRDEEWSQWGDNKMSEQCAVSNGFVGILRVELASPKASLNGSKIETISRKGERGEE